LSKVLQAEGPSASPEAGHPPSVIRMIVLPGVRRSGANAAGASASGRTAPIMGLSRASLSRWARSASRFDDEEDGAPVFGLDRGRPGDGDERAASAHGCSRAVKDLTADHVEDHVGLAGVLPLVWLQLQEGMHSQAEGGVTVGAIQEKTRCQLSRASPDLSFRAATVAT
jgi:hypothetical protein